MRKREEEFEAQKNRYGNETRNNKRENKKGTGKRNKTAMVLLFIPNYQVGW